MNLFRFIRSFHSSALLLQEHSPSAGRLYSPQVTLNPSCADWCGPLMWRAGREVGVGTMRVAVLPRMSDSSNSTFLALFVTCADHWR
jgi:hypothetical protein